MSWRGWCGLVAVLSMVAACGGPRHAALPAMPRIDFTTLPEAVRTATLKVQAQAFETPNDPEAVGRLGMTYIAYDFPAAAAICMQRASALAPKTFRWLYYAGVAHQRATRNIAAIEFFGKAIAVDDSYVPALVRLADLVLEKDNRQAQDLYARAARLDPNNPVARFGLGECARVAGDGDVALDHFRRAVSIAPDFADAHYALAMLLASAGRAEQAREHLRQYRSGRHPIDAHDTLMIAVDRIAPNGPALQQEAMRLADDGRLDEAATLLEEAILKDRSGVTARRQMGMVRLQQKRYAEAIGQFRRALEADSSSIETRSYLGLALARTGRPDQAAMEYREVLRQHPDDAQTRVFLGELLFDRGERSAGLVEMGRGVELQPANSDFHFRLAHRLILVNVEPEAIEHLRKVLALNPRHAGARYTLGGLLQRAGDRVGAKEQWQEAVRIAPSFADVHLALARLALEEGDAVAAVKAAEKAYAASGRKREDCRDTLARAYRAAGRPQDAARLQQP